MKPRLLDLFCGAGGAAMGYHRAGFELVGVDHVDQPNYPFEFYRYNVLDLLSDGVMWHHDGFPGWRIQDFNAVHASPPCQFASALNRAVGNQDTHENLIPPTRKLLLATGLPYVIENVPSAPLVNPVLFCGAAFGLEIVRHRIFETNFPLMSAGCAHLSGGAADGTYVMFGGRSPRANGRRVPPRASEREWRDEAGLDFMPIRDARQAIPPAYTEHIGGYLLTHLKAQAKVAA